MKYIPLPFSRKQWELLAFLEFVGTPVSVDLAHTMAPLSAASLLDLVQRGQEFGLLSLEGSDVLSLSSRLPAAIAARLERINTPEWLLAVLGKLEDQGLMDRLPVTARIRMLDRTGRDDEAARLEIQIAYEERAKGNLNSSTALLEGALNRLSNLLDDPEYAALFVEAALALSYLAFYKGKNWEILPPILKKGRAAAQTIGNRRSAALMDLHLGGVYYFTGRRVEALSVLASATEAVKDLGDEDILDHSAGFIGLFYFLQGFHREALHHFERAVRVMEVEEKEDLVSPLAPVFMGYCSIYLGQLHRAIGALDYNWRLVKRRSDPGLATTIRTVLATALLYTGEMSEAAFHLSRAKKEAIESNNDFALYLIGGAEAYQYFLLGQIREAYSVVAETVSRGMGAGLVRLYASPWALEMLFEFDRLGFKPVAGMTFQNQFDRIMQEPNIHLKGIALRLRASRTLEHCQDVSGIDADLDSSEEYLLKSGDRVQLAKTWLEKARLRLKQRDRAAASLLAKKARLELSGPLEGFFPDDLRYLLEGGAGSQLVQETREELVDRLLSMLDGLLPSGNPDEILVHAVSATNKIFGAERGGLFWFKRQDSERSCLLRVGYNLNVDDISSEAFKPYLRLVRDTFRQGKPIVVRPNTPVKRQAGRQLKAVLCIPFSVGGSPRGVLYHDNSYLNDCFDFLDSTLMLRLAKHLTMYIERNLQYSRHLQDISKQAVGSSIQAGEWEVGHLIAASPIMIAVINQADLVANSEATVLIGGETGVGKELLARRIHSQSSRRQGPFVVVDPTAIPDTLLESELFGHEKGAFTGADRQKLGRFELADGGTLFIDEIGEISLPAQAKLLRAIQEKMFSRVGGTRDIKSDFRLVAASNRDLSQEVSRGRFREDLYYRINVVKLYLPPLRERAEDLTVLANHFLKYFKKKYGRPWLKLSSDGEARLKNYHWPGNIRELRNLIERAVVLSSDDELDLDISLDSRNQGDHPFDDHPTMNELQHRYVKFVLEMTRGKISGPGGAAEWLGMKRSTLESRMKKLGLR